MPNDKISLVEYKAAVVTLSNATAVLAASFVLLEAKTGKQLMIGRLLPYYLKFCERFE